VSKGLALLTEEFAINDQGDEEGTDARTALFTPDAGQGEYVSSGDETLLDARHKCATRRSEDHYSGCSPTMSFHNGVSTSEPSSPIIGDFGPPPPGIGSTLTDDINRECRRLRLEKIAEDSSAPVRMYFPRQAESGGRKSEVFAIRVSPTKEAKTDVLSRRAQWAVCQG
jgi:hypothetical protein